MYEQHLTQQFYAKLHGNHNWSLKFEQAAANTAAECGQKRIKTDEIVSSDDLKSEFIAKAIVEPSS